jgi:hypothetical protein
VTPPVASVVVEAEMIGDAGADVDAAEDDPLAVELTEPATLAAELASPVELDPAPLSSDPPATGSGDPLSGPTPCWPCLAASGVHAKVDEVCSAKTHSDSTDKGNMVSLDLWFLQTISGRLI